MNGTLESFFFSRSLRPGILQNPAVRPALVKLLGVLSLAVLALAPASARASRPTTPAEPGAALSAYLGGSLGAPRLSEASLLAASAVPDPDIAFDLGDVDLSPSALEPAVLATGRARETSAYEPLRGIALADVERLRGPPDLGLENRIWALEIFGQKVIGVTSGVSTRLAWSCGGPGLETALGLCFGYIDKVRDYEGGKRSGYVISRAEAKNAQKILDLAIPPERMSSGHRLALEEAEQYARREGVDLRIFSVQ